MASTTSPGTDAQDQGQLATRVLPIKSTNLGEFDVANTDLPLEDWEIRLSSSQDAADLQMAAEHLKSSDIPVAFPTETVYGLGADATRSAAVKGIYRAKQRPSDNPLIVHVASLSQLRRLLHPASKTGATSDSQLAYEDPIPTIYHTLIKRFWPGPLTILLNNPVGSALAPEVTAGLDTFGARMPRNLLALALIKLADVPVAAPSANASTKPSPTAAEHVLHDLNGRIELIVDGGCCDIGVESTVVDGLSLPPSILRPGGIGLEQIRSCPGWENTTVGYRDASEKGTAPRAPGMKYRHYSPKAPVILLEAGGVQPTENDLARHLGTRRTLGIVRTKYWQPIAGVDTDEAQQHVSQETSDEVTKQGRNDLANTSPISELLQESRVQESAPAKKFSVEDTEACVFDVWDLNIGPDTRSVARGLFSALRTLDQKDVDAIIVEGIEDLEGDTAAAVMNRLRKAAEIKVNRL
ncbi:hypothetical protein AAFC00_001659 [Neodothiora populina]|uniref:Threonylcarbamoyl-AMP synthase n=1 Tax=Neodothiora populina TaxID=2781224 RepID=A0ABR3PPR1_9PEZI